MKRIPEQVWVFTGSFVFYLLTLAENFSGPHDSITYLNGLVDGYPLVNQHHLLYHYTAYGWLQFWQLLFPSIKDYYLIEAFSALWGSLSLAVVYSFFRNRFHFSGTHSAIGMLVVAFSYGFWFYSVNIEVYAPPLFFILLALYYLTKKVPGKSDWWKIIMLHILAILFHQVNILFAVIVLFKLWQQRKQVSFLRWLSAYSISGIALVGTAYFIIGWIVEQQNTLGKWYSWMKGYAGGNLYWEALSAKTPLYVTYGFSHAMLGGHYVFQIPLAKRIIDASLSSHSLNDELFIARNISPSMASFLLVLTVLLGLLSLWMLIRFLWNFRLIYASCDSTIKPLLLTFFLYSAFFTFWMPEILEFWILQTVLLWLLFLGTLPFVALPFRIKPVYVSVVFAFLLFCINYFGSMRWMQDKENDWYYVKTKTIQNAVTHNDLVILQNGWIIKDFLHYFTNLKVQVVPLNDSSELKIDSAFNNTLTRQGRIFILPEYKNDIRNLDAHYLDSLRKQYAGRLSLFREKDPEMWVIE